MGGWGGGGEKEERLVHWMVATGFIKGQRVFCLAWYKGSMRSWFVSVCLFVKFIVVFGLYMVYMTYYYAYYIQVRYISYNYSDKIKNQQQTILLLLTESFSFCLKKKWKKNVHSRTFCAQFLSFFFFVSLTLLITSFRFWKYNYILFFWQTDKGEV